MREWDGWKLLSISLISERHAGFTELLPSYRVDLRQFSEKEYNKFVKLNTVRDWSQLSWMSVGLIEHFPDSHKPEAIDWHRKFLKPDGYAIFTTPRNQWKSRLFYRVMADIMNHTYRELMTVEQMGLYI